MAPPKGYDDPDATHRIAFAVGGFRVNRREEAAFPDKPRSLGDLRRVLESDERLFRDAVDDFVERSARRRHAAATTDGSFAVSVASTARSAAQPPLRPNPPPLPLSLLGYTVGGEHSSARHGTASTQLSQRYAPLPSGSEGAWTPSWRGSATHRSADSAAPRSARSSPWTMASAPLQPRRAAPLVAIDVSRAHDRTSNKLRANGQILEACFQQDDGIAGAGAFLSTNRDLFRNAPTALAVNAQPSRSYARQTGECARYATERAKMKYSSLDDYLVRCDELQRRLRQ